MNRTSDTLGNSAEEQSLLRPAALWAADYAEQALLVFETLHPEDKRPREAIEAGRAFGLGKKRDNTLRSVALGAIQAGKDIDQPSKYVARAATLTAAVAYTHTDLHTGSQGVRQARHILGPVVYAALALETNAGGDQTVSDGLIHRAIQNAPDEVIYILNQMPPQPKKNDRLNSLFYHLDSALRHSV